MERPDRFWNRAEVWTTLLLVVVFLTGLPGIFTYPAERILFNPQAYKQALADEGAYRQLPEMTGQFLAQGGERIFPGSGGRLLSLLNTGAYQSVVDQIFPVEWVQSQSESLVDQFWAYFNFQTGELHLWIDIRPIKGHLTGPDAPQIASTIVAGLPPCTTEQILNFALQAIQGKAGDLPLCQPPEQFLGLANLLTSGILQASASTMPDQIDLVPALALPTRLAGQPAQAAGARAFEAYRLYRQVDVYLPWVALAALALAVLVAFRTAEGSIFWAGWALLLPGFTALLLTLALGIWVSQVAPLLINRLFGSNLLVFDLLVNALGRVSGQFITASGVAAMVVALIGGGLVAWSMLRGRG